MVTILVMPAHHPFRDQEQLLAKDHGCQAVVLLEWQAQHHIMEVDLKVLAMEALAWAKAIDNR